MGKGETVFNSILGTLTTFVLLSQGALAPLLGGGVAGYLQQRGRGGGAKVGAVTGLVSVIVLTPVFLVVNLPVGLDPTISFTLVGNLSALVLISTLGGFLGSVIHQMGLS